MCIRDRIKDDYKPVQEPSFCLSGKKVKNEMQNILLEIRDKKIISEYDVNVGMHLAHVMSGGNTDKSCILNEQNILDLERESFINLISNVKSQDKINLMLSDGKKSKH